MSDDTVKNYALVLIESIKLESKTFSYLIPDKLANKVKVGSAVLVPFGFKIVNGFVVGFSDFLPPDIKAKNIIEILDDTPFFNSKYYDFLSWVADYYFCDIKTVLSSALPLQFLKQSKQVVSVINDDLSVVKNNDALKIYSLINKAQMSVRSLYKKSGLSCSKFYSALRILKESSCVAVETILEKEKASEKTETYVRFLEDKNLTKRQQEIIDNLKKCSGIKLTEFEKLANTTRATIKKLENLGAIELYSVSLDRNPLEAFNIGDSKSVNKLSALQNEVYLGISEKINSDNSNPVLLHGVTASGKTEIYFKLMEDVINQGKNILFLLPEIALASEITKRIAERFGVESVSIWHSSISDGEKFDVWQKLKQNKIKILAGARSAVFAPLQNIGLIIIDEEHESAYKQTTPEPRYDARVVAQKLANLHNATLILGSATPDIKDYYFAKKNGNLFVLNQRYNNSKLAKVVIVDMKLEQQNGNKGLLSRTLHSAITKNLEDKKQTIILMNRRGFSTQVQCLACGEVITCKNCSIPMVWHANSQTLKCHYCGEENSFPEKCPFCGSESLQNSGAGIEKIELTFNKLFPDAVIKRLDSDSFSVKNEHLKILQEFHDGKIDILIGTQMIAKGLDNKNVTVVGVVKADQNFNLPDFRSEERGFQLLTQVAGRAGRGDYDGKVYFQTYNPEFFAIQSAKSQNYEKFYEEEISERADFSYPPFSQIIRLVLCSKNEDRVKLAVKQIKDRFVNIVEKQSIDEYIEIMGGNACVIEKIRQEYRYQIIIKNLKGERGQKFIKRLIQQIMLPDDIRMIVDVDPVDML